MMNIFEHFPTIHTDRLILRAATLEDCNDAFTIYSDPKVMSGHGESGLRTIEDVATRLDQWFIQPFQQRRGIRFVIATKENKMIGSCGFWRWEKQHNKAEIGYELSRAFHGQGIMKEALLALLEYGFTQMKLNRIEAKTDHHNIASQKTLLSLGFQLEGIQKEAEFENDNYVDMYLYALLKKEWRNH